MKLIYTFVALLILGTSSLLSSSKKVVLVEQYTSAFCEVCGTFDGTFKGLMSQYSEDAIPIVFHTGLGNDIIYRHNTEISGRFLQIYQLSSITIPTLWIDGTSTQYSDYGNLSNKVGGTSPVTIKVLEERTAENLNITIGVESDVELKNHRLFVYVMEDNLFYPNEGTSGVKDFRWIARRGLPSEKGGSNVLLGPNKKQGFTFSTPWHAEWNKSNIYVVAFVQSFDNNEMYKVYNAAKTGSHELKSQITSTTESLDFGDVSQKKTMEFTIMNEGLKKIKISDFKIEGDDKGVFNIVFGGGTKEIGPYGSQRVIVEYFPKENGTYNAKLVVNSDAENKPTFEVKFTGKTSDIVKFSQIYVASDKLEFGDVSKLTTKNIQIKNVGTGPLNISSIVFDSNDEDVFSIDMENTSNIIVNVDQTINLPISFKPLESGKYYFADLVVNSDSKENPTLPITLSGRGIDMAGGPSLVLSNGSDSLAFGELEHNKTKTFKVKNTSNNDIEVTEVKFEDYDAGSNDSQAFQLVSGKSTWVVANGETSIAFKFNPTESKEYKIYAHLVTKSPNDELKVPMTAVANFASVGENELSSSGLFNLSISPNPVNNIASISFSNQFNKELVLELYNSNGEFVENLFKGNDKSLTLNFNSSKLSNGKYFIIANVNGMKEAFSLIINK